MGRRVVFQERRDTGLEESVIEHHDEDDLYLNLSQMRSAQASCAFRIPIPPLNLVDSIHRGCIADIKAPARPKHPKAKPIKEVASRKAASHAPSAPRLLPVSPLAPVAVPAYPHGLASPFNLRQQFTPHPQSLPPVPHFPQAPSLASNRPHPLQGQFIAGPSSPALPPFAYCLQEPSLTSSRPQHPPHRSAAGPSASSAM